MIKEKYLVAVIIMVLFLAVVVLAARVGELQEENDDLWKNMKVKWGLNESANTICLLDGFVLNESILRGGNNVVF